MEEGVWEEFKEDFALLIEAGFIAVKQLDEISAKQLFFAAQQLNPTSPAPLIGLGYIALNKLEVDKARRIFEDVVDQHPEHHLALTFLGMCLLLKKETRRKGEELIKDTKAKTDDPTVKNLCEVSLSWAEKDLKKKGSKAPFFSSGE